MELSVVIPSWNTLELTRACLASIRAAEKPETEVIVIDNASEDGSADMIEAEFDEVRLVRNAQNEGFAKGCNQGMRLATGRYVLLLNADTEVRGRALSDMVEFLEANPEHGGVAPQLVHPDGRVQAACMRFPNLLTPLFFATPLQRWFPKSPELRRYFMMDWDHTDERDVDQPPAACLLVRREVLDQVGLFDEELWLFFNDVDFSLRMAEAGWKTRFLPRAKVMHHLGASTSKYGGFLPVWHANRLHYFRKHHGRASGPWVKLCVLFALTDFVLVQGWRRLRGRTWEDPRPAIASFWQFLRA